MTRAPRSLARFGGSVTIIVLIAAGLIFTAPFVGPVLLLASHGPRGRHRLRLWVSLCVYVALELVGLSLTTFLTLLPTSRRAPALHRLQSWWASSLAKAALRLFRVDVIVEGLDQVPAGRYLLLSRHATLIDTILPSLWLAHPRDTRLRYVLKAELLADPCLNWVGNQLPNAFVTRSSPTPSELEQIRSLAHEIGDQDAIVLYPEGTRFTPEKQESVLASMQRAGSPWLPYAQQLRHTLPPRFGGFSAILDEAAAQSADIDIVFLVHHGFDFLTKASTTRHVARACFWKVPAGAVPTDHESRKKWLYEQWQQADAWIDRHRRSSQAEPG